MCCTLNVDTNYGVLTVLTGDRRLLGLTVAMFLLTIFRMEATFGETLLSGSLNSVS